MKHAMFRKSALLACASLLAVALVALAACTTAQSSSSASSSALSATADVPASVVPNVVSLTLPDAEKSLVASGFKLGKTKYKASSTVPAGNIVSQKPAALENGETGQAVAVVVSSGKAAPKEVKVPDVKGLHQAEAEKALSKAGLVGVCAGSEESTEVEPGLAFKQSVEAGTKVKEKTKVTFTLALAPKTTKVPDVVGKSEADATKAIRDAGLGFDSTHVYSDDVDEGVAISQSYAAGTEVQLGTTVSVSISLGSKPAEQVTVPNVITYSWSDAEYALESAGLTARYTGDPSGVVVDQDIEGGRTVDAGTLVTVMLSEPDEQVTVPNLVGMSVTSAEAVTDSLGLSLDGNNYGIIVDQAPAAGTLVDPDATISIKTEGYEEDEDEEDPVEVPDLVGMNAEDAENTVANLGLSLDGDDDGTVIEQSPAPGTMVEWGDTVSIKTSNSEDPDEDDGEEGAGVQVPDLIGMEAEDAGTMLENMGLSPDGDSSGTVVDQSPAAGTWVDEGDTVSIDTEDD